MFYIVWMNFSEAFKDEHYKKEIEDVSSTTPFPVETQIPGDFLLHLITKTAGFI